MAWALVVSLLVGTPVSAGSEATSRVSETPSGERELMRGMTVSCPRSGEIWGTSAFAESLAELRGLGVGWVSIHPYGGVRRDGEVRVYPAAERGYLDRAVILAEEAGIQLFWKPHLAYWGSFEWRGAIEFGDDETAWRRFFADYERFIVDQARFAADAEVPLFAVGVELEATTHRETEWRRIVERVRAVYPGRITYAANWDSLDKVPFWDAVDLVGVQAYFPLTDAEHMPSRAELDIAWDRHLGTLRTLAERWGRPVVLTEIGYDLSPSAARQPWHTDRRADEGPSTVAFRDLLMTAAIERVEAEPSIVGMFWWKWMPGRLRRGHRDFPMRHPSAKAVLERLWRGDAKAPPRKVSEP